MKRSLGVLILFALVRACLRSDVYPADDPDYGVHLSIVMQLLRGEVWPLPYAGIIGAHASAAIVHLLSGLALPKAMLLVSDLALIATFAGVVYAAEGIGAFAFVALTVPIVMQMEARGFYGHHVSFGAYAIALALYVRGRPIGAGIATVIGATMYPDGAMWLLPAIAWPTQRTPLRWALLAVAVAVSGKIFVTQLGLAAASGAAQVDWTPQLVLAGVFAAFALLFRPPPHVTRLLVLYLVIVAAVVVEGAVTTGTVGYYARKNLYPLAIMLPLLAASLPRKLAATAIAIVLAISFIPKTWIRADYVRLVAPRSPFMLDDVDCAQTLARACKEVVVIPAGGERQWNRALRIIGYAAYTRNSPGDAFSIATRTLSYPRTEQELMTAVPEIQNAACLAVSCDLSGSPIAECAGLKLYQR